MGRIFLVELEGRSYRCKFCGTHLALPDQLVSKCEYAAIKLGKRNLKFNKKGVNITVGAPEERSMFSGLHIVADIFCCCCGGIIGWKYEAAHESNGRYEEGKFVLERGRIVGEMDLSRELFIDTHPE